MVQRSRRGFRIAVKVVAVLAAVAAVGLVGLRLAGQRTLQRAVERSAAVQRELLSPSDSEERVSDPAAGTAVRAALAELEWTAEEASAIGELAHRSPAGLSEDERALVEEVVARNREALERLSTLLAKGPVGPFWAPPEPSSDPVPPEAIRGGRVADRAEIEGFGTEATRATRLLAAAARTERASDPSSAAIRLATLARLAEALEAGNDFLGLAFGLYAEHLALRGGLELLAAPGGQTEGVLETVSKLPSGAELGAMVLRCSGRWRDGLRDMLNPSHIGGSLSQRLRGALLGPALRTFTMAAALDLHTDIVELVGIPYGLELGHFEDPPPPPWWRLDRRVADVGLPDLRELIRRGQLVAAERQLLEAAVAMRRLGLERGAYPAARPALPALGGPDPYSGHPLEYDLLPDGRLRLAVAGGEALTVDMTGAYRGSLAPVLLPAP